MGKPKVEELMETWKELHIQQKKLEPQLEQARSAVKEIVLAGGKDFIETKHGTIAFSRKTTTNWEALARELVNAAVIEKHVAKFQKTSEPFIVAPSGWNALAKLQMQKG